MTIENELVERYGREVLSVRTRNVPARMAKEGHMLAVVPRCASRGKLVRELRREGSKAHIARHRVTKEVTTNHVFTNALHAFAKHAHGVLAEIPTRQIVNLYGSRPQSLPAVKPLETGDDVKVTAGPFAGSLGQIVEKRGRRHWLVESMGRKFCVQTSSLIRIDPG